MMNALLQAIEEGRLIELPDTDKRNALTLLASLIEAIPGVPSNAQIVERTLAREEQGSTYMRDGIACPHARTSDEGAMLAAIGWSPKGIPFGNEFGEPARLILLYYIPDAHRNAYLKEISILARTLQSTETFRDIATAPDLSSLRLRLLEMVSAGLDSAGSTARARMIQLETRAAPPAGISATADLSRLIPLWIVQHADGKLLALTRDAALAQWIESQPDLAQCLPKETAISRGGWTVFVRQSSTFELNRQLHDCLAIKSAAANSNGAPA